MAATQTLVQNTSRAFTVTISSATIDLSTAATGYLYVHRMPPDGAATIETWTCTITAQSAASLTLTCALAGATPGPQAVTIAGERLRLRPYLTFSGSPDVSGDVFNLTVVEA